MIGGGNYLERETLAAWASRSQPPRQVLKGRTRGASTGPNRLAMLAHSPTVLGHSPWPSMYCSYSCQCWLLIWTHGHGQSQQMEMNSKGSGVLLTSCVLYAAVLCRCCTVPLTCSQARSSCSSWRSWADAVESHQQQHQQQDPRYNTAAATAHGATKLLDSVGCRLRCAAKGSLVDSMHLQLPEGVCQLPFGNTICRHMCGSMGGRDHCSKQQHAVGNQQPVTRPVAASQ
jgi:hypothetical protein